jgi:hypothetical protein
MCVDRLRRLAPLSGALAAVLWTVSVAVLEAGGNPADPDSGAEVAQHFADHRTAILVAGLLHTLGGFFFLWFLGAVWDALRRLGEDVDWLRITALVSGAAAAGLMLALTGPQTTGATTDIELLEPQSSVAFWRLSHTYFVGAEFAFSAFVATLSLLALARGVLPRWLGWFGLFIALVLLIVPVGWIALLLLVPIWLIATSVVLFRRASLDSRSLPPPAQ